MSNPCNNCDFTVFEDNYGNMSCRWKNGRVFHLCMDCYGDDEEFDWTCEHCIKHCYCSDCNYGSGRDDDYACDCCNCQRYRHCKCEMCASTSYNGMCKCCFCKVEDKSGDEDNEEIDEKKKAKYEAHYRKVQKERWREAREKYEKMKAEEKKIRQEHIKSIKNGINPFTKRKIKVGGTTYKKIAVKIGFVEK